MINIAPINIAPINIEREKFQEQSVELFKKNDVLIVEAGTGVGKSKIAIDCQDIYPSKTLLVVAERAHIQNWIDEYKKHGKEYLLKTTTIICYASLHKYTDTQWSVLIMDEAHHLSPNRLISLGSIQFNKAVFMSATFKKTVLVSIVCISTEQKLKYIFSKMPLKESIDNQILPEPKIYIHKFKLDNKVKNQELIVSKGNKSPVINCVFEHRFRYIGKSKNYTLNMKCTELEKYKFFEDQVQYYQSQFMRTGQERFKLLWLRNALNRKKYLGELKTNHIHKVLKEIPENGRMICFCNSIDQAKTISSESECIHSKCKNTEEIINNFQEGKINSLYCVEMLREGMNLNNIQYGVIIQLDNTSLAFIQKIGRVLRAVHPVIHIMCYENTRDAEYLEKCLLELDQKYIYYV